MGSAGYITYANCVYGSKYNHQPDYVFNGDPEDSDKYFAIAHQILQLSPLTHFQELISGSSEGGGYIVDSGSTSTIMRGIFDINHTLGYWIKQYWVNLIILHWSSVKEFDRVGMYYFPKD